MLAIRHGLHRRLLARGVHSIGRDLKCDFVVDDISVSRHHARVIVDAHGQAQVEDLGSRNGTLLNADAVAPGSRRKLDEADVLQIGSQVVQIETGRLFEEESTAEVPVKVKAPVTPGTREAAAASPGPATPGVRALVVIPPTADKQRRPTPPELLAAADGPGRVLLVEDDPAVRLSTEAILGMHFDVVTAGSSEEALELVDRRDLDVLVVDFQLPRINGLAMLQRATEQRPHLVAIMLTGHAEDAMVQAARATQQVVAVLQKPADPEALRRWVVSGVRAARLRRARARLTNPARS